MKTVKSVIIVILIIVLTVLFIAYRNQKSANNALGEISDKYRIENDSLRQAVSNRDALMANYKDSILLAVNAIERLEKELFYLRLIHDSLKVEYDNLADYVNNVPPDSSYYFLVNYAYDHPGEKIYPFNEDQVQGMHLTYLENISCQKISSNLYDQVSGYLDLLLNKNSQINALERSSYLCEESLSNYMIIDSNQRIIINSQEKEIIRQQRTNKIWKILTGIAFAVGVIL